MAKLKTGRHTSALKELRKSKKRHKHNVLVKTKIKTLIKQLNLALKQKDLEKAKSLLRKTFSALDKAGQRKVIHQNKANRKKARLAKKLQTIVQPRIDTHQLA